MDHKISSSTALLGFIRKDPEVAALNRHRMPVFEDEIMKRRDSVHEVRASRVLTTLWKRSSTDSHKMRAWAHPPHSCIGN